MDPHLDDELKEYLRLIDATVKSASTSHISPQKISFAQLPQQFKTNEFLQNIILMNNNCEEKELKIHYPLRKKPEMLDDSISDWNIGSQQTTLESPKSQEDIKDLCIGLQGVSGGNNLSSHNIGGQNLGSLNSMIASQQFSQKLQRYFPEQQFNDQQHLSCLCSLDQSSKPSRNIVVQLNLHDDIEQFLAFARQFGDIQNVDRHKFQYEKILVLSFYNISSSLQAFQAISSSSHSTLLKVSYLNDFNDFDYIDYMLISNANSFNQKLVLDYLGWFGKIFEYSNINSKLVVRYFDVRSLKEIDRIIKLLEKDRKSFVYLHRTQFPEVEEKFILELLKNIFIFSKENTTDIMLKNTRVKPCKQTNSQQQQPSNIPNQKQNENSQLISQLPNQLTTILPISPNNASSPPLPNLMENNYNQRVSQQPFFASNNLQNKQQQLTMNNVLNNFFNFDENTNTIPIMNSQNENFYSSNQINQQKGVQQGMNQQVSQQYCSQQRRELQEIGDYQNFFLSQQQQFNSQQNKFVQQNSSSTTLNSFNENYVQNNNENENIPLTQLNQQQQLKKMKKMNPNACNFSTLISNNSNYSNNNGSNSNCQGNVLQNNCQPNMLQNTCQANLNQLSQSLSNLHISQENGSSQQQMQLLQQISQSSSSSLTSTNFPQFNQGNFNNFNSLRKSQDENPFSASSLRMSFDNNPIYQMNSSFYSNNNNNSSSNINPSNTQNVNSMNFNNNPSNINICNNSKQAIRSQNNQQTQFMNLLNCSPQFNNEMRFNNNNSNNINFNCTDQYESNQSKKQFSNIPNANSYPNQQLLSNQFQQTKVNTILGSNGAKSQTNNQNFQVNLENISHLKDRRATIMVRNIPNRYNQEDFLRIIDINYKGLYDFVYLPMDFKNHCNIGYAFINFIDAKHIIPFYKEFNGKRWEMIRSEKVCYICYARIQGRNELIAHFKKSGVMSAMVEKSFKPLILPNPQLDLLILQQ